MGEQFAKLRSVGGSVDAVSHELCPLDGDAGGDPGDSLPLECMCAMAYSKTFATFAEAPGGRS